MSNLLTVHLLNGLELDKSSTREIRNNNVLRKL